MNVTISVTQDDINEGEPAECGICPIALAARRALKTAAELSVFSDHIKIYFAVRVVLAALPRIAQDFIIDFDNFDPVQPFSFDLDIADDLLAGAS